MTVMIFAFSLGIEKTSNLYDNFQFKKINPVKQIVIKSTKEKLPESTLPQIKTKKINPAYYEAVVSNSKDPFNFIFNETFDPGWEALINGKKLTNHFLANGFANGWKVDQKGEYTIKIFYSPQKIYWPLFILSNLIFFGAIIYLCLPWLRIGLKIITRKKRFH
jgi:hypothetical protein